MTSPIAPGDVTGRGRQGAGAGRCLGRRPRPAPGQPAEVWSVGRPFRVPDDAKRCRRGPPEGSQSRAPTRNSCAAVPTVTALSRRTAHRSVCDGSSAAAVVGRTHTHTHTQYTPDKAGLRPAPRPPCVTIESDMAGSGGALTRSRADTSSACYVALTSYYSFLISSLPFTSTMCMSKWAQWLSDFRLETGSMANAFYILLVSNFTLYSRLHSWTRNTPLSSRRECATQKD